MARVASLLGVLAITAVGCSDGDRGKTGQAGEDGSDGATPTVPTRTALGAAEDLPGVVLTIVDVKGASGTDGTFQVGDRLAVTFTIAKKDGDRLPLDEIDSSEILVSGPTFNYQLVLPRQQDILTLAEGNDDGSYTYTFAAGIPATYPAPLNDTASFGAGDGELKGQALLQGTYTVGMRLYKNYAVGTDSFRDTGIATKDVKFGGATAIEARDVVAVESCNECHVRLEAHGGSRREVKYCLLCHTSGAEDGNVANVHGGTPGVAIDFRVLIHKIHNGANLPSVLGVGTNVDGTRNYAAAPQEYIVQGRNGSENDFSEVAFPVWPNLNSPMPRDMGYTTLTTTQQGLENTMRSGAAACEKCHGDPDGSGPIPAPAQGNLAYTQPSRRACGSCHDDVDWARPYVANQMTMPAQAHDGACAQCHAATGNALDAAVAHVHPLKNPTLNPGFNVAISALGEGAGGNNDGTIDPGERVSITFSIKNDAGADIQPSGFSMNVIVSGPNDNRNMILYNSVPTQMLGALASSYTILVPERVALEYLGRATAGADVLQTDRAPHVHLNGDLTSLQQAAFTGTSTTTTSATLVFQNFLDVATSTGLANDNYVVVDKDLESEEYVRVRRVVGTRLWLSTRYDTSTSYQPYLRLAHAAGATVEKVTVTTVATSTYVLDTAAGTLTEANGGFTTGRALLGTYTTPFIMPATFPPPLNDSDDMGESWGEWTGKPIVSGTYALGLYGSYQYNVTPAGAIGASGGDNTTYRNTSRTSVKDFLVGSATEVEPYDLIDLRAANGKCADCHDQILFHGGGRRDVENCLLCHATAGAEDWPIFRSTFPANPTTGVTITFRSMIHKLHKGKDLFFASTYVVNGNGGNGTTFEHIGFPAFPGGVQQCTTCHGDSEAWEEPAQRRHPTAQVAPGREWRDSCGSCHDSDAEQAHIGLQTLNGVESCDVCHGAGSEFEVPLMHKTR